MGHHYLMMDRHNYHLTGEKTEAQRGEARCARLPVWCVAEPRLKPRSPVIDSRKDVSKKLFPCFNKEVSK